jgi:uncharacterized protein (TIGR03382 family)
LARWANRIFGILESMRSALVLASLLISSTAFAHIAMTVPAVRTADQKIGPCGAAGSVRGSNITEFQPGETITLEWDETVDHPGHYRVAFDDDGNDFVNPNNPDDAFPGTMIEPIADKAGGHYTQQITLPTTPCDNCTLQLVQVMTTSVPYNSFYFQCADIKIAGTPVSGDVDGGNGGGDLGGCAATSESSASAAMLLALFLVVRRTRKSTRPM